MKVLLLLFLEMTVMIYAQESERNGAYGASHEFLCDILWQNIHETGEEKPMDHAYHLELW